MNHFQRKQIQIKFFGLNKLKPLRCLWTLPPCQNFCDRGRRRVCALLWSLDSLRLAESRVLSCSFVYIEWLEERAKCFILINCVRDCVSQATFRLERSRQVSACMPVASREKSEKSRIKKVKVMILGNHRNKSEATKSS